MSKFKWYAVREPKHDDDDRAHTVSNDPNQHGWENDMGCDGYGLTWEQAKDIETLSARLEEAEAKVAKLTAELEDLTLYVTERTVSFKRPL